jgi:hypothetical protein
VGETMPAQHSIIGIIIDVTILRVLVDESPRRRRPGSLLWKRLLGAAHVFWPTNRPTERQISGEEEWSYTVVPLRTNRGSNGSIFDAVLFELTTIESSGISNNKHFIKFTPREEEADYVERVVDEEEHGSGWKPAGWLPTMTLMTGHGHARMATPRSPQSIDLSIENGQLVHCFTQDQGEKDNAQRPWCFARISSLSLHSKGRCKSTYSRLELYRFPSAPQEVCASTPDANWQYPPWTKQYTEMSACTNLYGRARTHCGKIDMGGKRTTILDRLFLLPVRKNAVKQNEKKIHHQHVDRSSTNLLSYIVISSNLRPDVTAS